MVEGYDSSPTGGIYSILDTDLYKLTMQCAVLKYFPDVDVTYSFTNRTPHLKLNRAAYNWLLEKLNRLGEVSLSEKELEFLKTECSYLNDAYLRYLQDFRFKPKEHIDISFDVAQDTGSEEDVGEVHVSIKGLWLETILYEIPVLALTSEAYFRFCDKDWTYDLQKEKACRKGCTLLENKCQFSEFGTRRRRNYKTQDLVMAGLIEASNVGQAKGWKGAFTGTSNVYFAMKYGVKPVGTVAHEWYMGIAAITNDYENANEMALRYWLGCFGRGVLAIALTDTFGTPVFLEAFSKTVPAVTSSGKGSSTTLPSSGEEDTKQTTDTLSDTIPPIKAPVEKNGEARPPRYAEVFTGIRQDSGDPAYFVKIAQDFYEEQGIREKKSIVFSDSLNIDLCLEYKVLAEEAGFKPVFGVGTFFTNDFERESDRKRSVPLNIVIKISSAGGRPAVKLSDNMGKNTGDSATVSEVKRRLGYVERKWENGDESSRWGR